jgi:hypothetical protein
MRFLLSIHDVWPGNFPLVAGYADRLRTLGAGHLALLVVPAYHGQPEMDGHSEFVGWLREESARGTELFLHGYRHWMAELAEGPAYRGRRTAWGRWVNGSLVDKEAEFCGLERPERERLLDLGLASFIRADLPLAGFVAPTWHGAPPTARMRARGIPLWESRFAVRRLSDGAGRLVPPLAWSPDAANGGPRLLGGSAWLGAMLSLPCIKVALHPGDLEGKDSLPVLERVIARGTNIRYADLFPAS